jgi:hypothetical protein
MAGNFLKYGAAEASFGSKNSPRPTFVSYGVPEKGDAHWLDQQGSFMATVAAGPVFRLLGARDLDGVNPKVIVLLAGTNNVGKEPGDEAKVRDVTRGIQASERPRP